MVEILHIFNSLRSNLEKKVVVEIELFGHLRWTNNPINHILTVLVLENMISITEVSGSNLSTGSSDELKKIG
jgi:hypothetical protein